MKPRLQAALGQQLVMTPQLRQAIRLLQLSAVELEAEIAAAVESNPLLDWTEPSRSASPTADGSAAEHPTATATSANRAPPPEADWGSDDGEPWYERIGPADDDDDDARSPSRSPSPTPCTTTCSGSCT